MRTGENLPRRFASESFDAFGFDVARYDATMRFLSLYFKYWHRVSCKGLEKIPDGPMIAYGNHAGFNLLDALMLMVATRQQAPSRRPLRLLHHIGIEKTPLIGYFMQQRLGAVIGHPANAEYILGKGDAILTYPEGGYSTSRPFTSRRSLSPLDKFGAGFLRLAARTGAWLLPVATVGCEEAMPTLALSRCLGRHFKFDQSLYPIVPQSALTLLPSLLGVPLHHFHFLLGLPSHIRIRVGAPWRLDVDADIEAARQSSHHALASMVTSLENEPCP